MLLHMFLVRGLLQVQIFLPFDCGKRIAVKRCHVVGTRLMRQRIADEALYVIPMKPDNHSKAFPKATHTHTDGCIYNYTRMCVYTYVYLFIYIYIVFSYINTYLSLYVYIYIHVYLFTY